MQNKSQLYAKSFANLYVVRNSSFIRFFIMNTKTSFSYSLIALALWSTYSFGAVSDDVIAGTPPTHLDPHDTTDHGQNIFAGDGPRLYPNARNNIMNTTGKPLFGGSYSLVMPTLRYFPKFPLKFASLLQIG